MFAVLAVALSLQLPTPAPAAPALEGQHLLDHVLASPVPGSGGDDDVSVKWRIWGAIGGGVFGGVVGGVVNATVLGQDTLTNQRLRIVPPVVLAPAGAIAGYFLGREADDGSDGAKVGVVSTLVVDGIAITATVLLSVFAVLLFAGG